MKSIFKNILLLVKGAVVGVGAILPGVSGGVLCVAFGIYEPMMAFFTHPIKSFKIYYKMFIPFLIGWTVGFIFLAKAVQLLFDFSPEIALMLFFGLICGTVPGLFKESEKSDPQKSWTPFVIALTLAYFGFYLLENSAPITISPSFITFVLGGLVWGLSLIVPGLSSSSVLIILGIYSPVTAGIGALDFNVVFPFAIGISATVLMFSRLVTVLYNKHYAVFSRVILGFVLASSLNILPSSFENPITLLVSILCFALGFVISRKMDIEKDEKNIK